MKRCALILAVLLTACPGPARPVTPVADPAPAEPVKPSYPASARQDVVDTIHGVKVADPYRWLEDASKPEVGAWMTTQHEFARAYLDKLPDREELGKRLADLFYYDAIGAPHRYGERFFYLRKHSDKEKSILYWKQGEEGAEKVLIDPNTLTSDGSTSLGGWFPSNDGKYLAYALNPNNADHAFLHVLEVDSGKGLARDVIDGARYATPQWTPDNAGFYYVRLPVDPKISPRDLPGHAHVRYHALGSDPSQDPVFFPATGNPKKFVGAQLSRDGRYLFVNIQSGWNATEILFKDVLTPVVVPKKRRYPNSAVVKQVVPPVQTPFHRLVDKIAAVFELMPYQGKFYVLTNYQAPRYRILEVDPAAYVEPGAGEVPDLGYWKEIVAESDATLEAAHIIGGHLVLSYLRDAHSELEVRTLAGEMLRWTKLPGLGSAHVAGDQDHSTYFYSYSSYTEPPKIFKASIGSDATTVWAETKFAADTSNFVTEQVWYPSKDGTKISMFLIRRKDATRDGNNPTVLYGYGGFNQSMKPKFSPAIVAWLERGGMWAVANLRGGGEYGEEWHRAGMLLEKQNVFDDYIAAAEWLRDEGWTRSKRLAIRGGSNGGLLVGAAMTQRPDLYQAVICGAPLLDMVRYHMFGSGMTWVAEYGSADDAEQFEVLHGYSPYHRVVEQTAYPAMLMMSPDSDDRVDPSHARKFTAAVQWATRAAAPILMRVEKNSGHTGADMVRQRVAMTLDQMVFLIDRLGM